MFMTYFGGNSSDHGAAVITDAYSSIYVGGSTYSTTFPVYSAFQPQNGGGQDGFVAKFNPNGQSLVFSSYYGGSGGSSGAPEEVNALAIVIPGSLFVGGTTSSPDFPITPGVMQTTFGGGSTDGFIGSLSWTNGALRFGTPYCFFSSLSSSAVRYRHRPGANPSDSIPANDVRASRMTRKPVASPIRRICKFRPSVMVSSSQVLPPRAAGASL